MGWKKYNGKVTGTLAKGDDKAPKTTLATLRGIIPLWKKVTVFEVPNGFTGSFRIGFIPQKGPTQLRDEPVSAKRFAMRNGHEDCTFFAIDDGGKEVPLKIVEQTTKDKLPPNVPLF